MEMDLEALLNNTYTLVFSILLLLCFLSLCLYYGLIWMRVARYKNSNLPQPDEISSGDLPSVSVVIVAHNESPALKKSLPYLLEQDYPDFEVVVVDYVSADDTPFVLRVCSENYPNLKTVKFKDDVNMFRGKKYPLSIGIKSATKDVVLLTEADCTPTGFDWIRQMVCGYMRGASIVMGYSLLNEEKGLLNALQRYERMTFTASYTGMALLGNPYTATGRNLSYKRDFFFQRGGFIKHYVYPEGADSLFVNQNANRSNTAVVLRSDAVVVDDACSTFGQWRLQRLQQRLPYKHFAAKDRLSLTVYPLSQILFILSLVLLWTGGVMPWYIPAILLAVKIIWQIIACSLLAKRFKIKTVQFFSPFFELYFLFADTFLAISALRRRKS